MLISLSETNGLNAEVTSSETHKHSNGFRKFDCLKSIESCVFRITLDYLIFSVV